MMTYRRNVDIDRRTRRLAQGRRGDGPVVYWMSRDRRVADNWALLWAQQEARIRQKGLLVIFCLLPEYGESTRRHYNFMAKGLKELQQDLGSLNIGFKVFKQSPELVLPTFLRQIDAHVLVTDFDPLRITRYWKAKITTDVVAPFFEVDTHNIIPAWVTSDKKEYAAYTIRPKIHRLMADYLTDIPSVEPHPFHCDFCPSSVDEFHFNENYVGQSTEKGEFLEAGESAARLAALTAVEKILKSYPANRNDPCISGQSGLSPYLHFGQLSPQRLAWIVSNAELPVEAKDMFIEELVVRRELAENFCLYELEYDTMLGFPEWAQKTLNEHRNDRREYVYSLDELEHSATHESLWNACQTDLVQSGKLHGYLRMYWAKKILEWTSDPETALAYAITLNDRYSLDGSDPNGYTGVAWSIGGVHDRAWKERPVFGKVRYMNEAGCRRKFDVDGYIQSVLNRQSATQYE